MRKNFKKEEAILRYNELPKQSAKWYKQISVMSEPFVNITDKCGELISGVVYMLYACKGIGNLLEQEKKRQAKKIRLIIGMCPYLILSLIL